MKILLVSFAFFLFAGNDLTTTNKSFSNNEEEMVTLEELMEFRNQEANKIEKLLKPKGWKDGPKGKKGERSWVLKSPKAMLYYYRVDKDDQSFEAPYLTLTIHSEDMYYDLAREADYLDLEGCTDRKHGRTEYHYYNKEYDILWSQSDLGNSIEYNIRVAGRKKK